MASDSASSPANGTAPRAAGLRGGVLVPSIAAAVALAILVSLGTWQLERKAWKEGLIATITERLAAPPVTLPAPAEWPRLNSAQDEFLRVTLRAELLNDRESFVYTGGSTLRDATGGPGYWVFTPARLTGGALVMVNRGFVPEGKQDPASRAAGQIAGSLDMIGVLRWPELPGLFIPNGDPARNIWFARDSTAICARERFPEPQLSRSVREKAKRAAIRAAIGKSGASAGGKKGVPLGPPKRYQGGKRPYKPSVETRLHRQRSMTLEAMLADLPRHCSLGVKTSHDGNQEYWRGYKLHVDVADGQIPISCVLTAASLHDSQAAIPLATMTAARVTSLYDVMDSAYDATEIMEHSRQLGHVPIVKPVKRMRKNLLFPPVPARSFSWAEADRFRERTMVERVYARLKDEFGAREIRVRGHRKIMTHLMFAVLALTADQILRLGP